MRLKRFFLSNAIRWKDRIFELVDREALAGIAGTDRQATFPAPHLK
jgi:hypothetical protein